MVEEAEAAELVISLTIFCASFSCCCKLSEGGGGFATKEGYMGGGGCLAKFLIHSGGARYIYLLCTRDKKVKIGGREGERVQ